MKVSSAVGPTTADNNDNNNNNNNSNSRRSNRNQRRRRNKNERNNNSTSSHISYYDGSSNGPLNEKKFIGGAERARREARKRPWKKMQHHQQSSSRGRGGRERNDSHYHQKHRKHQYQYQQESSTSCHHYINENVNETAMIHLLNNKKLRPSERFFASVLQSSNFNYHNYNNSNTIENSNTNSSHYSYDSHKVLQRICLCLGLPYHHNGNNGKDDNKITHTEDSRTFFSSRAILVMEESRYVFTEALARKYTTKFDQKDYHDASWMDVKLLSMEEQKRTGFGVLHFEKMNTNPNANNSNSVKSNTPWSSSTTVQSSSSSLPTPSVRFTPKELSNQRPGCCFQIQIQIGLEDDDNDNDDCTDVEDARNHNENGSSSSSTAAATTATAQNVKKIQTTKTIVLLGSILPSRGGGRDTMHMAPKVTLVIYDTDQIYQLQELQEQQQQEQPMTANDEASSLLDQLMGADRNDSPNTKNSHTPSSSSSSSSSLPQQQQQQQKLQSKQPLLSFRIRFCTTLISQCRQFEACDDGSSRTHKSGSNNTLLRNIMGQKEATHIRFNYSDDDVNDNDNNDDNGSSDEEGEEAIVGYVIDNDDDHHNINNEYYYENDYRNTNKNNDGFVPCFNDDIVAANNSNNDNDNGNHNHNHDHNYKNKNTKLVFQQSQLSIIDTTTFTPLNEIQEKAAMDFCHSKDGSLQLIQGPPGTGKTTFVVSVLARLLMGEGSNSSDSGGGGVSGDGGGNGRRKNRKRRILVTAPTNKAVSVIAKRFLESCGPTLLEGTKRDSNDNVNHGGIPIVLIGVEDKLLENHTNNNNEIDTTKNKNPSPSPSLSFVDSQMKRIFCYSWLSSLADDYTELLQTITNINTGDALSRKSHNSMNDNNRSNNRGLCSWLPTVFPSCGDGNENDTNNGSNSDGPSSTLLQIKAQGLHTRLVRNLPYLSESSGVAKLSRKLLYCLGEQEGGAGADEDDDRDQEGKEEGELKEEDVRKKRQQQQQRQQQQPNYSEARMCVRQVIAILKNESISNAAASFDSGGTSNGNGIGIDESSNKQRDEDAGATNNGPDNSFTSAPALDGFAVLNELLYSAQIVFCTLSSAATSLMKNTKRFDDWIVDEAAAATEPEIFIPLVHARPRRLLAVGDPMQLPALVASPLAVQWGLGRSLHERLVEDLHRSQTMLTVQYRMKPAISKFPSKQFYEGKLTNGANVQRRDYGLHSSTSSTTFDRDGGNNNGNGRTTSGQEQQQLLEDYFFFQVNGKECQSSSGSYYNIDEASAVIKFLRIIRKRWLYQQQQQQQKSTTLLSSWWTSDKIRIITFYSAQVATLKQMLRKETDSDLANVLVSTVDSSQGCEAEIVILSFVRTSGNGGFLNDDRRMNVALTRAKYKLLCLGNIRTISSWRGRRGASSSTNNTTTTSNSSTTTTTGDDGNSSSGTTLKKMIDDAKQRDCISYVWDHKN